MEIKDNEYVRTFSGGILTKKDLDNLLKFTNYEINEIVKSHAKRVSELVEVGDYVNGIKVINILHENGYIKFKVYNGEINDYELVSILTHEMYDNNVFVVEDELEWMEM